MSKNSQSLQKKKPLAKKQWKAAPSKPSATTAKNRTPKAKALSARRTKNSKTKSAFDSAKALEEVALLAKYYPDAHCALEYETAFQLLIATILSAQCTDERVNMVTKVLFKKHPDAKSLASAKLEDIEQIIRSTGFFKNKAKNIQACAQTLVEQYKSEVPQDLEKLVELPGVGRKTANVVLGNVFGIPSGIVVDTHVSRLSQRLGWTKQTTPEKIEADLESWVPQKDWIMLSHWLIFHGRKLCKARSPACNMCFLESRCPRKGL